MNLRHSDTEKLMVGVRCAPTRRRRAHRIAASGQARRVLDHIDRQERLANRPEMTWQIPYAADRIAQIRMPYPLEQSEWDRLMAVLDAMKEGLIDNG